MDDITRDLARMGRDIGARLSRRPNSIRPMRPANFLLPGSFGVLGHGLESDIFGRYGVQTNHESPQAGADGPQTQAARLLRSLEASPLHMSPDEAPAYTPAPVVEPKSGKVSYAPVAAAPAVRVTAPPAIASQAPSTPQPPLLTAPIPPGAPALTRMAEAPTFAPAPITAAAPAPRSTPDVARDSLRAVQSTAGSDAGDRRAISSIREQRAETQGASGSGDAFQANATVARRQSVEVTRPVDRAPAETAPLQEQRASPAVERSHTDSAATTPPANAPIAQRIAEGQATPLIKSGDSARAMVSSTPIIEPSAPLAGNLEQRSEAAKPVVRKPVLRRSAVDVLRSIVDAPETETAARSGQEPGQRRDTAQRATPNTPVASAPLPFAQPAAPTPFSQAAKAETAPPARRQSQDSPPLNVPVARARVQDTSAPQESTANFAASLLQKLDNAPTAPRTNETQVPPPQLPMFTPAVSPVVPGQAQPQPAQAMLPQTGNNEASVVAVTQPPLQAKAERALAAVQASGQPGDSGDLSSVREAREEPATVAHAPVPMLAKQQSIGQATPSLFPTQQATQPLLRLAETPAMFTPASPAHQSPVAPQRASEPGSTLRAFAPTPAVRSDAPVARMFERFVPVERTLPPAPSAPATVVQQASAALSHSHSSETSGGAAAEQQARPPHDFGQNDAYALPATPLMQAAFAAPSPMLRSLSDAPLVREQASDTSFSSVLGSFTPEPTRSYTTGSNAGASANYGTAPMTRFAPAAPTPAPAPSSAPAQTAARSLQRLVAAPTPPLVTRARDSIEALHQERAVTENAPMPASPGVAHSPAGMVTVDVTQSVQRTVAETPPTPTLPTAIVSRTTAENGSSAPAAANLDMDELAEQVYRVLRRRLQLERQRSGHM